MLFIFSSFQPEYQDIVNRKIRIGIKFMRNKIVAEIRQNEQLGPELLWKYVCYNPIQISDVL